VVDGRKFKENVAGLVKVAMVENKTMQLLWGHGQFVSHVHIEQLALIQSIFAAKHDPFANQGSTDKFIQLMTVKLKNVKRKVDLSNQMKRDSNSSAPQTILVFMANPSTQRESPNVAYGGRFEKTGRLRSHFLRQVVDKLRGTSLELQVPVLDAHILTAARWYASHDGTHYTESLGGTNSKQTMEYEWQGGVSHTTTQVLMNMMCNPNAEIAKLLHNGNGNGGVEDSSYYNDDDSYKCPNCWGGRCGCSWLKPTSCDGPGDGSCCFKCCCDKN
jgi:hypothetical protein